MLVSEYWIKLINEVNSIKLIIYKLKCKDLALKLVSNIDKLQVDGCITQILPSTVVISDKQLILASLITFKALSSGSAMSKKAYIEFLIRLFSSRQISKIFKKLSTIEATEYLVVRACIDSIKELQVDREYSELIQVINPKELMKSYDPSKIRDLTELYDIELPSKDSVDMRWLHATILTKVALSTLI